MVAIADIEIPASQFELGSLAANHPGMEVELERIVPLKEGFLPFFWVSDGSRADIEETLLASPEVEAIELLSDLEDRSLYQVSWVRGRGTFFELLVSNNGTVLEGRGDEDSWTLRIRFQGHEDLSEFGNTCEERGIQLEVLAVYNPHPPSGSSRLTPEQRSTLQVAHDRGFFEVPRRTTLSELAEEFDISKQAVSQRLRRGLNNVLYETDI
jgi:predicted DNA binding protein